MTAANYTAPQDLDANGTKDFQQFGTAPTVTLGPTDDNIFVQQNGSIGFTGNNATNIQWEVSMDGGATFNAINDGTEYSGTQTATLTVLNAEEDKNGYRYRAVLMNNIFICGQTITDVAVLTIGPRSVITNRRITLRVNKN